MKKPSSVKMKKSRDTPGGQDLGLPYSSLCSQHLAEWHTADTHISERPD